jgi:hypothetical protein
MQAFGKLGRIGLGDGTQVSKGGASKKGSDKKEMK